MKRIKKAFYWFLILTITGCITYTGVKAADIKTGTTGAGKVEVAGTEIFRNLFIADSSVTVKAQLIKKDLFAAGQNIDIDSQIEHNVFAAGNGVTIKGTIGGNIFAAGSILSISGKIDGDLFLAGATVVFEKEAELTGNIYAVGGNLKINGKVMGDVNASGGTISIGGTITGKAIINAGTSLTIDKTAVIENLEYSAPKEALIDSSAVVSKQEFTPIKENERENFGRPMKRKGFPFFPIVSFLGSLALAFLLVYLFRKPTHMVLEESFKNFGSSMGIGFAVLVATPLGLLIIAITMIGAKIAFLFGLLYVLFLFLGSSFAGIFLGTWVVKMLKKEQNIPMDWITILIGVSLLTLIAWIPFIGWFIKLALIIVGLGSLCKLFIHFVNHQ
jgi:hypothetical protein